MAELQRLLRLRCAYLPDPPQPDAGGARRHGGGDQREQRGWGGVAAGGDQARPVAQPPWPHDGVERGVAHHMQHLYRVPGTGAAEG